MTRRREQEELEDGPLHFHVLVLLGDPVVGRREVGWGGDVDAGPDNLQLMSSVVIFHTDVLKYTIFLFVLYLFHLLLDTLYNSSYRVLPFLPLTLSSLVLF